jgi:hypothetical protein
MDPTDMTVQVLQKRYLNEMELKYHVTHGTKQRWE